jgi:hypothetical protein
MDAAATTHRTRKGAFAIEQLQDGADWLYRRFYRLDRIILRTILAAFTVGLMPAYLSFRLNMTYRYDNRREGIVGKNPAAALPAAEINRIPGCGTMEGIASLQPGRACRVPLG